MFIGKQFDMIVGVDIHIIQPPGPVPPVPIPHPFIGIVFDPMEFVPIIGASILVNGIPRAQAGTAVKGVPPHIPLGGMFIKPPMNEGEIFMGSMTVNAEGEPLAYMGAPTLTCHDVGMVSIPRPKRKSKTKAKSMMLPTSTLICIPKGGMSMALGALTISMMAIGMKVGLGAFKKLKVKKRRKVMANWRDAATGKPFRSHELDGAADFEKLTKRKFKPTTTGKGDFEDVSTGEIFDHLGMGNGFNHVVPRTKAISQFKKSIDKHVKKLSNGVDELITDLKGFTPSEVQDIKKHIKVNHSDFQSKMNIINN